MECKVEKTQNANEVKLEIKIEAEKFEDAIKKIYFQNAKYFSVPGFRKGKAPQNIVERYYGKEIFYEDAFNDIAQVEYENALKENKIDVVSRPEIDIVVMEKGKDLVFTAVVQTKPPVTLKKYKGIEIEKIEYNVTEENVENELKQMQEKNSRLITVEGRNAIEGDTVTIDYVGTVDGKEFDGGAAENYDLVLGSHSFIEGFEEQVVGMKIEEEKDIKVTFPENYFSKELEGKEATFKVKLCGIKAKELPELDDEFAKDVSEFDTIAELKESIKTKKEEENKEREKNERQNAVVNELINFIEVDIPSGMIEIEIENMLEDLKQRMEYQGLAFEQYLKLTNQTKEGLKKQYEPDAIKAIKIRLAIEEIIKLEKIEAKEEEITEEIEKLAKSYGKERKEIEENENVINNIKQVIQNQKAIEFLLKNSKEKKQESKKEEKHEKVENKKNESKKNESKKNENKRKESAKKTNNKK